ncbi:carboxypeptidase-like regulatory domain-containing protein [Hymenobacter psoromatis]|uniref:carboxypeptidase-like regulatory domain-containing protein n=1 Tax=Hymenobacter psoromatis TaxID=1484116 RepID=UPI001CC19D02|nr:carboxypeptidase-like regulatory domain-containing protein [Hymenobacter psoromatis]
MSSLVVHIPRPCAESWAAMTPTPTGRHCAACQKVVVDFTQKTDAEILAFLTEAKGETCGHLRDDQLNRPLLPALSAQPAASWRSWLALGLAAWGLRASPAAAAGTPASGPHTVAHPRKKAGPRQRLSSAPKLLRGTVRASDTHEPLAGVAVFLKGENRSATTNTAGNFSLALPTQRPRTRRALVLHCAGYQSATVPVAATPAAAMQLELRADTAAAGATIVGYGTQVRQDVTGGALMTLVVVAPAPKPFPWHPGPFWRWLTQPFRHN